MLKIMNESESEQFDGPWIGYEAAAKHTDLSETWLRQLVMRGEIPFKRVRRRVLFSVPALDRWISNHGVQGDHVA